MSEARRIAQLERDVTRLEDALVAVARQVPNVPRVNGLWSYRHPRSGPLGVIWKRVERRAG